MCYSKKRLISLPENLIIEILSWLPVKSLLRYKSVSKSWYKIIKSSYFISMHLKHNYGCRTNCLLAQYIVTQAGERDPELLWLGDRDERNTIHDYESLQVSLASDNHICGPCYGIYYSWSDDTRYGRESRLGYEIPRCLWNPALKEIKELPPMIMKPNLSSNLTYHREFCGFGFDPVTVDYKVVAIKGYKKLSNDRFAETYLDYPLSIMIYSLRTDSWKYLRDLSKSYYIRHNVCYSFVNTSFYWLGSDKEYTDKWDVIIAIDLATEVCQEIGLPEARIKGSIAYDTYSECLTVYDDSIALVALYDNYKFDIWTLTGRIWSKEFTVKLDVWVKEPLGHYYVENNLVLFYVGPNYGLILCDPDTEDSWKIKYMTITGSGFCETVSVYMESLVPLNDPDFWKNKDKGNVRDMMVIKAVKKNPGYRLLQPYPQLESEEVNCARELIYLIKVPWT